MGYGDEGLNKESSRFFATFYMLTSVLIVTLSIGSLAEVFLEIRNDQKRLDLMSRKLDFDFIRKLDDGEKDGIDKLDFVVAMLVRVCVCVCGCLSVCFFVSLFSFSALTLIYPPAPLIHYAGESGAGGQRERCAALDPQVRAARQTQQVRACVYVFSLALSLLPSWYISLCSLSLSHKHTR